MNKIAIRAPEVARLLSISERKLWQMCKTGGFPHVIDGRTKLFLIADIEDWLQRNRIGGSSNGIVK